jgi:phosphoesterase RecJ-like protein
LIPMQVPHDVIDFIASHSRFLILGHKEPDGDCIASQIAFGELLDSLGKQYRLFSVGPFDRPEISQFEGLFASEVRASDLEGNPAVVVLDCSTADRTGSVGARVQGLPTLVIDHHSSGEAFGSVRFVVISCPATTLLVLALSDAFGLTPSAEQARLILFGLCTDTGFFRHLGPGTGETFRTIARLVEAGTSTAEIFQMVYGKRDLHSRKLLALMLQRTESYWGDRLLLTWQTMDDRARMAGYLRGEDELYRLLQTVKGNEVVVFIKEEFEGRFSVGFRSNRMVDVGAVAASFGGGGHRQAAGCDMTGSLEPIKKKVIEVLGPILRK